MLTNPSLMTFSPVFQFHIYLQWVVIVKSSFMPSFAALVVVVLLMERRWYLLLVAGGGWRWLGATQG